MSTDGIDFGELVFKAASPDFVPLTLDCYDFGGQAIYYPSHEFFLARLAIYLITVNATELTDAPLRRLRYWVRNVKAFTERSGAPIVLVCTHADLLTEDQKARFWADHPLSVLLEGLDVDLAAQHLVSCRTGEGIPALLQHLEQLGRTPSRFPPIPGYFIDYEAALHSSSGDQFGRTSAADCFRMGNALGLNRDRVNIALQYLVNVGTVLYFQGTREQPQSECYLMQPRALANLFRSILTTRHQFTHRGLLQKSDLFLHIWRDVPSERDKEMLLAVLEQFELILRTAEPDTLLVPSLLPPDPPAISSQFWPEFTGNEVGRVIKVTFLLKGFFPRVLFRAYHFGFVEVSWRHGVLVSLRDALGSITEQDNTLSIRARFSSVATDGILLFTQLLAGVESVFESYGKGSDWHSLDMLVPYRSAVNRREAQIPYLKCIEALKRGENRISIGSESPLLDLLIPDITLAHIKHIPESELEVGRVLGEGGFGVVHYAVWRERPVAVKSVKFDASANPLAVVRDFCREVDIMSRLHDPCLVTIYGVTDSPMPALVMEYVASGDLATNFHFPDPDLEKQRAKVKSLESIFKCNRLLMGLLDHQSEEDQTEINNLKAIIRKASRRWFKRLEQVEWKFEAMQEIQLELQAVIDLKGPQLRTRILESDRRLGLDIRLRVAHDVAQGLSFLHSCNPPFVHNDVRSPNVFLVQIQDAGQPAARLADYGLVRWRSGPLKMGLDSWQWLAPEVIDGRSASGFTERADIYSFGIILWETLNGAGLNPPFSEHEGRFAQLTQLKKAIKEENLRPTLSEYCREMFAGDPRLELVNALLSQCFQSSPTARPSAHQLVTELRQLLGLPPLAALPQPDPETIFSVKVQPQRLFELSRIQRTQFWTCSCGCENRATKSCATCERARASTRVMTMCFHGGLWLGLKTGVFMRVPGSASEELVQFSLPREEPVLSLAVSRDCVWALSSSYLCSTAGQIVRLDKSKGHAICLTTAGSRLWLLQYSDCTNIAVFRTSAHKVMTVPQLVTVAAAADPYTALASATLIQVYKRGKAFSSFPFDCRSTRLVDACFYGKKLIVASLNEVTAFSRTGDVLHRVDCGLVNVRCVAGEWAGTTSGLYSLSGWLSVAGHGEIACLLLSGQELWAADNTGKVVYCYRTNLALPSEDT